MEKKNAPAKSHSQHGSQGVLLTNSDGASAIDLIAGLASCLGHRHPAICKCILAACESHLGSPSDTLPADWLQSLGVPFSRYEWGWLTASADEANERAIQVARVLQGSGDPDRYRIVTLLGSKHGDTFAMRSASGWPEKQGFDGPVAAGYRHASPGDIAALAKLVDDSTAAVFLSPVDWNAGGIPFETEYLSEVQSLCREKEVLLVVDETRLPPGVSGRWFFHERADITPDLLTLSAGWTGGLPGGIVLGGPRLIELLSQMKNDPTSEPKMVAVNGLDRDQPLLRAIVRTTAAVASEEKWIDSVDETADAWAAMLDDLANGFDFIRSCSHAGLWTTLELDLPATDVANQAWNCGLRILATDDTTLLICPPINVSSESLLEAMAPLRTTLEAIEQQTHST